MSQFYTITTACAAELRVKDSRFIAWLAPANTRERAEYLINERSRLFSDASHNCFAFRIGLGPRLLARASDAQEPVGSAGRPMLQALEARALTEVAAVASRYFGGTKLGVGGLRRAYGDALQAAIAAAQMTPLYEMSKLRLTYQYHDAAAADKAMRHFNAEIIASDFGAEVRRMIALRAEHAAEFCRWINELSSGRISAETVDIVTRTSRNHKGSRE